MQKPSEVLILGGGPAGLMAAHDLAKAGVEVRLLEMENQVGGMSRTHLLETPWGEFRFDFGGHRFITGNPVLLKLVEELVGEDLLQVKRSSVIRFQGRTYDYPLNLGNLFKTAPLNLLLGASKDLFFPQDHPESDSFEGWMLSHFGPTLYREFFKDYTEKLWGIPASQLSADWASQRISLLDLKDVAKRLLSFNKDRLRTYAQLYRYPKWGIGQIFTSLAQRVTQLGGEILTGQKIVQITRDHDKILSVRTDLGGEFSSEQVISTLPLDQFCSMLDLNCQLRYRGLRFVDQPLDQQAVTRHTWQYLSDPQLPATRLQEPKRRSPFMAPVGKTSAMLEIPAEDQMLRPSAQELVQSLKPQLKSLNVDLNKALGPAFSKEAPYAYPLLEKGYQGKLAQVKMQLAKFKNLTLCGRQACFRYVFMDTAMEMGQMAARLLLEGKGSQEEIFVHKNEKQMIETQSVA